MYFRIEHLEKDLKGNFFLSDWCSLEFLNALECVHQSNQKSHSSIRNMRAGTCALTYLHT